MSQGDEVEQHETGSFERTEACECYPPEFHRPRVMHSHSHVVCRNEDRDVKLTVGGRLFHGFISRSVKKFVAHHWQVTSQHCGEGYH